MRGAIDAGHGGGDCSYGVVPHVVPGVCYHATITVLILYSRTYDIVFSSHCYCLSYYYIVRAVGTPGQDDNVITVLSRTIIIIRTSAKSNDYQQITTKSCLHYNERIVSTTRYT